MNYKGFTTVKLRKPERSRFDMSHELKMSSKMGQLTPIYIQETIPNDTFNMRVELLMRFAPMLAPIMHRVEAFVHFFFVPNRLLWKEWETFITAGRLGASNPVPPYVDMETARTNNLLNKSTLADYLGFPTPLPSGSYTGRRLHLMPFMAYHRVWLDYYRDRNFIDDDAGLPLPSGLNTLDAAMISRMTLKYRAWRQDYFTSALPFVQRGASVLLPLIGTGTVQYKKPTQTRRADNDSLIGGAIDSNAGSARVAAVNAYFDNIQSIDISNTQTTINDLRRAVRLQEWYERNALAGSRYNESIMAHFGRRTSDARLQRAEYLGGGKLPIKISEIPTTAYSQDGGSNIIPPGRLAGNALAADSGLASFSYNCEEHGFIIGILSVLPRATYQQGAPRMFWKRDTFLDYPWPTFAHLGEQEVYKAELYADSVNLPTFGANLTVFGYQSRYADWKDLYSRVSGDFRDTLDFWHLGRKFASSPNLNENFVTFEQSLQDRIFAVSGVDVLWSYIWFDLQVTRSLPYYGTPTL